jgi:hypothetical protein
MIKNLNTCNMQIYLYIKLAFVQVSDPTEWYIYIYMNFFKIVIFCTIKYPPL